MVDPVERSRWPDMKVGGMRSIDVALGALLAGLSLAIPIFFRGSLQIWFLLPIGYTATFASHVPTMLSMLIGPQVAALAGVASTIGFLATFPAPLNLVVAARAFTHILFGVAGAIYVVRGGSYVKALFIVALPIHAIGEALAVAVLASAGVFLPPTGILIAALVNLGGGVAHHIIDSLISILVARLLRPYLVSLKIPWKGSIA